MASIYFRIQPLSEKGGWRVVGNCPSLGSWDSNKGFPLSVRTSSFWTSERSVQIPDDRVLEYKYVFSDGAKYIWESLPCNRSLVPSHSHIIVTDQERSLQSKTQLTPINSYTSKSVSSFVSQSRTVTPGSGVEEAISIIVVAWMPPVRPLWTYGKLGWTWELQPVEESWVTHLYHELQRDGREFIWIGAVPSPPGSESTKDALRTELLKFKIVPVFFSPEMMDRHQFFIRKVLLPVYYSLISTGLESIPQYSTDHWDSYRTVNAQFADCIMDEYTGAEVVWLHNSDVLMTPSFITRRSKDPMNLGLTLHHPFPPSEIFKVLPHRSALLNSMLSCDLVGFQSFEYARHFISACKRMIGATQVCRDDGTMGLEYCGRFIALTIGYCGVSQSLIEEITSSQKFQEEREVLVEEYKGKKVLVAMDRFHPLSGLLQKVELVKGLLQQRPSIDFSDLILLQLTTTTSSEEHTRTQVQEAVANLNQELGRVVIKLIEANGEGVPMVTRLAYFSIAIAYFNSVIREGFSLNMLEFILMHPVAPRLVISEFSGFAKALKSPILINPFDVEVAWEKLSSIFNDGSGAAQDVETAKSHSAKKFVESFLTDLRQARKNDREFVYQTHGMGDTVKLVALGKNFDCLFNSDIQNAYKQARNRLIISDNEGTLMQVRKYAEIRSARPSDFILECLDDLCSDDRNSVYIITGRGKPILDRIYDLQGLGLVAEYGSFIKDLYSGYHWERTVHGCSVWVTEAAEIMETYVSRVEGSYLELKDTSVMFHYGDADPDYGAWQAQELVSHLDLVTQPHQCEVISGSDYVEVKSWGVSKGSTLVNISAAIAGRKGSAVDFVLALGDGVSDESMFRALRRGQVLISPFAKVYSCAIGMKPTLAQYYLQDIAEVQRLLDTLRHISLKVVSM